MKRTLAMLFLTILFFVPSAFAQSYGGQYGGNWEFQMSIEMRNRAGQLIQTINVNALPVTMPATTTDANGWITSRVDYIPGASSGSYVIFRSHPNMPGSFEVVICYFNANAQYVGEAWFGDVTADVINQRQTIVGGMVVKEVPRSTGRHRNTGIAWVTLRPN